MKPIMKPTITNAFNSGYSELNSLAPTEKLTMRGGRRSRRRSDRKARETGALVPMQVDLRESEFGWSLELNPIIAADAIVALMEAGLDAANVSFLVSLEQSAWREGKAEASLASIAKRLMAPVLDTFSDHQLVLDGESLLEVVALCQPTRLLVVAVEGPIERSDAAAINAAIDRGASPLGVELRALAAIEVIGDRSVVLHVQSKNLALALVAQNFPHYLAAVLERPAAIFAAPELWQVERVLDISGAMNVRPIETEVYSTSIDVGVCTAPDRAARPADVSLIYDIHSNSWHDEH